MNVCIATGEYLPQPGGIATFYAGLAWLLAQHGHRVTVLTVDGGHGSPETGVEVIPLAHAMQPFTQEVQAAFGGAAPSVVRHIATGLAMAAWLEAHAPQRGFDVVETPEFGGAGAFLASPELPPLAVTCHGSYGQMSFYQDGGKSSAKYRTLVGLETLLLASADGVSAYSPANAQAWTELLQRAVAFVPAPWVDAVAVAPSSAQKSAPPGIVEGIVVGRLQNWKGALDLVEALALCRRRGVAVRVTWVGRDTLTAPGGGSMLAYIRQQWPEVWDTTFHWREGLSREETRRAQAAADFALVPSRWDTLNFTAVEAMSVGTPLIVSSGAGASYLVEDGESGLVTPPQNPAALADAIQRIATDQDLRLRLGRAGPEVIRREFDPQRVVACRVTVYGEAIQRRALRREQPFLASASGLVTELMGWEHARAGALFWKGAQKLTHALKKRWLPAPFG